MPAPDTATETLAHYERIRAEERERCARELEGWAAAVESVGIHKEQAFAYRNGAAAIRNLNSDED